MDVLFGCQVRNLAMLWEEFCQAGDAICLHSWNII
jgi:hypothetical protein